MVVETAAVAVVAVEPALAGMAAMVPLLLLVEQVHSDALTAAALVVVVVVVLQAPAPMEIQATLTAEVVPAVQQMAAVQAAQAVVAQLVYWALVHLAELVLPLEEEEVQVTAVVAVMVVPAATVLQAVAA